MNTRQRLQGLFDKPSKKREAEMEREVPLCIHVGKDGQQCRKPLEDHFTLNGKRRMTNPEKTLRKRGPLAHKPEFPAASNRRLVRNFQKATQTKNVGASHGRTGQPAWFKEIKGKS